MLIGAIADDLTGATDLALALAREGMRTIQVVGVPEAGFEITDADAVVVALKSRTIPAQEAVHLSLAAYGWLKQAGADQIIFKYCSTFDSTPRGNIGPVTDALLAASKAPFTVICPAFPANGRTIYKGHLFVKDELLSDSPMRDHPLTPMRDSSLLRLMAGQSKLDVGLIQHEVVKRGADAIRTAFAEAASRGKQALVVDAIDDGDLRQIGAACAGLALITGGSGIALGLPQNFRDAGKLATEVESVSIEWPAGRPVLLAGSCSQATRSQIDTAIASGTPAIKVDPVEISKGHVTAAEIVAWALGQKAAPPLIYSSADPAEVRQAQDVLGKDRAGAIVEKFFADMAVALHDAGIGRFVVAGGETSGAVTKALNVPALRIGPEIAPGVPWTVSTGGKKAVALALKSGNFGSPDFFREAVEMLE